MSLTTLHENGRRFCPKQLSFRNKDKEPNSLYTLRAFWGSVAQGAFDTCIKYIKYCVPVVCMKG